MALSFGASAQDVSWREEFSADPGWDGYRNRLLPDPLPVTRQDFGLKRFHGDQALGGWIQRSLTPAWFAKVIPVRTLENKFSASGKFAVSEDAGSSGILFGWFNNTSRGWRTPNSFVFRLDGNGGKYWVFYEYGTRHWLTGGGGCFEGKRYQTTPTKPFAANGAVHTWSLTYDPNGGNGAGLMTFALDDVVYLQPLLPGHKADGAEFNRFGLINLQTTGSGMETWFTDLVLDGEQIDLTNRVGWEGFGNQAEFKECHIRPYHDFGWNPNVTAGGEPGAIGGIIWRDEKPAYYAAKIRPCGLEDRLIASGKISFNAAGSDSGVYLGWFNSQSKTNKVLSDREQPQRNILAILIEGPSRIGHYFRPQYRTASGAGQSPKSGPIIHPDGRVHKWALDYSPRPADGTGEIKLRFDDHVQTLKLTAEHRRQGALFDHFGLFNLQVGGHFVDVTVDDLNYANSSPGK